MRLSLQTVSQIVLLRGNSVFVDVLICGVMLKYKDRLAKYVRRNVGTIITHVTLRVNHTFS